MSRSSSVTVVSPVMMDGVSKIAAKLAEIGGDIEGCSPDTAVVPDIQGELLQDISKLQDMVKRTKIAQDNQIKDLREEVASNVKKDITKMLEDEISVIIKDSIAAQVEVEMADWGNKPRVPKLVNALEAMVETNNILLEDGRNQLENSLARHANSTIEIQGDFNTTLKQIKRKDGRVSELFPASLRYLFSYEAAKLIRLLEEYDLHPLEKHNENLNRFLIFIGVNISVPDQLVEFMEEQLPAYPLGNTAGFRDEKTERSTRRRSSASERGGNTAWYNVFSS